MAVLVTDLESSESSSDKKSCSIASSSEEVELEVAEEEQDRARYPYEGLSKGAGYGLALRDFVGVREGPEEAGKVCSWTSQPEDGKGWTST